MDWHSSCVRDPWRDVLHFALDRTDDKKQGKRQKLIGIPLHTIQIFPHRMSVFGLKECINDLYDILQELTR
ncbi:hypothetical protein M514_11689, partial [Trichuris suis]